MSVHDIPGPPQRSRSAGRVRIGLAVVLGALGAGVVRAESTTIDQAAEAASAADRVIPTEAVADGPAVTGEGLLFPIDPMPRCEVLNNFGGHSKSGQSGGHQGVDIGADHRQEVYAVEDGVLTEQVGGETAGIGWKLLSETGVQYRYYHLDAVAEGLEEGDAVVRGQLIGYVGDTGNATPGGWHLHFEVRPGPQPRYGAATPVDPVPLLDVPSVCNVY